MAVDKTAADENALVDELLGMLKGGKDGIEAGLSTTEFWLVATSVVIDIEGPKLGFLQGIDANEQGLIALALVIGYTGFRSWRKRGGPAKLLADTLKAIATARGAAPVAPVVVPAPVEAPKAA